MTKNSKSVLFLGSGATSGSGIIISSKTNSETKEKGLPSDGNFFDELEIFVNNWEKKYPALSLFRSLNKNFETPSLYQTWNDIFIYRGLAWSGVIRENANTREEFFNLANHTWPENNHQWRSDHYHFQFQIIRSEWPFEYYLAELAIWDLRVLIQEVYDLDNYKKVNRENCVYKKLWKDMRDKLNVSAVVNLNYDTTFDRVFFIRNSLQVDFYYPGDNKPSKNNKPLIRPHGSLEWTSRSLFSIPQKSWIGGWRHLFKNSPLSSLGYRQINDQNNLTFSQSLIVSPAMVKEEIVGNSSYPGLTNDILKFQWLKMNEILEKSNHWIFIGVSFASGDDHLSTLLKRLYNKDKKICCSIYGNDTRPLDFLVKHFGETIIICIHKIPTAKTIDHFFNNSCNN